MQTILHHIWAGDASQSMQRHGRLESPKRRLCSATFRCCCCAGDEFHLVHIVKDETEKLREYYQEKSLGAPHPITLQSLTVSCNTTAALLALQGTKRWQFNTARPAPG